jgi:hypothetical protein
LTRLHWKGHAFDEDDGSRIERQIDFTVSDLTKVIDGVQTRVAWERDYSDGEMGEVELTYYAQDDARTVWYSASTPRSSTTVRSTTRRPG